MSYINNYIGTYHSIQRIAQRFVVWIKVFLIFCEEGNWKGLKQPLHMYVIALPSPLIFPHTTFGEEEESKYYTLE